MILGMLIGAEFIPNDSMDADISITSLKGKDPDELPGPQRGAGSSRFYASRAREQFTGTLWTYALASNCCFIHKSILKGELGQLVHIRIFDRWMADLI